MMKMPTVQLSPPIPCLNPCPSLRQPSDQSSEPIEARIKAGKSDSTRLLTPLRRAFTLLEMVLAMAAFALLLSAIFSLANGTIELSADLSYAQERAVLRQNFIDFLRRSLRTLPGDAEVRLKIRQSGSSYLPTINIVNGGTSLSPGEALPPDTSIELFAEERPGGYLRVSLRYLDEEQTALMRQNQDPRLSRDQITIPLLDDVARFEWRFFDTRTDNWEKIWEEGRRPLLCELNLKLDDGEETRAVFWVPPVIAGATQVAPAAGIAPQPVNGVNPTLEVNAPEVPQQ